MLTISIWGSCVSRDTLDLAPTYNSQLSVGKYIARQTWISATSGPIPYPGDGLSSKFQSRMLRGDFASNALSTMIDASNTSDFIVLDLVDDRFSTVEIPSGQHFTFSATAKKEKLVSHFPGKQLIKPGNSDHARMWLLAAEKVREAFDPIMEKIVVFGGPWAAIDQDGNRLPRHLGRSVNEWNYINAWFLESLKSFGFKVFELPDQLAIADSEHRWGRSPFHYIPQAYDYWAEKLLAENGHKNSTLS